MKGKRRHELSENVLAHELGMIKEFFNRYGNWIMVLLVAGLVVFLLIWHYRGRSIRELAEQSARYETLRWDVHVPDKQAAALAGLGELAENARDPLLSASAAMDVADFCAGRYVQSLLRSDAKEARELSEKAQKYYRMVIQRHPDLRLFVAKAHLGLGVLAENGADWMSARAEYTRVTRLVSPAFPVAAEAQLRLSRLERWSQPVRFATTEPTTRPVSTGPSTTRASSTQPTSRRASPSAGSSTPRPGPEGRLSSSKPARTGAKK